MSSAPEYRLLLVEDVPQVAQHVRSLLNAQAQFKLLDVVTDGRAVLETIGQLHPDAVLVDALLVGKVRGLQIAQAIRQQVPRLPVVVVTVPHKPVAVDPASGVDGVLTIPFNGYELMTLLHGLVSAAGDPGHAARVVAVYSPKGGVGKTTIAFNLAVALAQRAGLRTALVDGSLQFGDVRALLQVPDDAPSILDLPTDRIQEGDLAEALWRDPSGIEILLAPPRIEQAEMVSPRDVGKILSMLRRLFGAVVIDMPVALGEVSLALLDAADTILEVVTWDSTTIHSTRLAVETFRTIGYPPAKIQYLLNRADSAGGLAPETFAERLGRPPDHTLVSDGRLVIESNNEGVAFVLAQPEAPISRDIVRLAERLAVAPERTAAAARR